MLGRASGRHLHALAHNHDPRPVQVRRRRRSIGAQHALGRGRKRPGELAATLAGLVDRVARRLRTGGRRCRTVVLRMRFDDFTRATRSHTMLEATVSDAGDPRDRAGPARGIDADDRTAWSLTLIGVSLTNLTPGAWVQLALPFAQRADLDAALDAVRERYGSAAITRGALVGRDPEMTVPLLPDYPDQL